MPTKKGELAKIIKMKSFWYKGYLITQNFPSGMYSFESKKKGNLRFDCKRELKKYITKEIAEHNELEKLLKFKKKADKLLSKFEKFIDIAMPQKGDKTTDCQKLTIQQAISEVYYSINGTTQKDLL